MTANHQHHRKVTIAILSRGDAQARPFRPRAADLPTKLKKGGNGEAV